MGPRPVRRQPLSIKVPDGYGLRVLDEVDSTNTEAARLVWQWAGPEWILARRQTTGRGPRGRAWSDSVGNVARSFRLFP